MYVGGTARSDEPAWEIQPAIALPYARHGRRFIAFLIDLALGLVSLVLVVAALGLVTGLVFPSTDTEDIRLYQLWSANEVAGNWILVIFTYIAYFVVPEARSGATLGKRLLHLRVVTESGGPIDWSASLLRNLLRPIDVLGGFLFALPSSRRQRLGDRAANTVVVRK